jgi:hypothetical protein
VQPDARHIDHAALRQLIEDAMTRAGGAKALAAGAGIHVANIHAYRRGSQIPHWETVGRIAAAGGVSEQDLLRASGWGERADSADQPTSQLTVLEAGFARLNDHDKELFLQLSLSIIRVLRSEGEKQ